MSKKQEQDELSDEQRHPDSQEIVREPKRAEIEATVKKEQIEQSNYMDMIIYEYLNLDYLINIHENLKNNKVDQPEKRVKIPKPFYTMQQARENLRLNEKTQKQEHFD